MEKGKKYMKLIIQVPCYNEEKTLELAYNCLLYTSALELQQKNTKIAMEQMQAQIAALQAKLNGEDAR